MALGFAIPEVKFLSITLDGGEDLLKKTDEPHTNQEAGQYGPQGDTAYAGVISNTTNLLEDNTTPMKVEIILAIKSAFDVTSKNIYSSFFKNNFSKYIKLRVLQSTSQAESNTVALLSYVSLANSTDDTIVSYIDGVADGNTYGNIGLQVQEAEMSDFDGLAPEMAPDTASSIEVKYDSDGNKIYLFPYKFTFTVPKSQGGTKVNHLSYFAHAYIDIQEIVTDEGLFGNIELPQEIVNQLSIGKVSGQAVIQGGTTNNFAQVFYQTPVTNTITPTGDVISSVQPFPLLKDEAGNIIGNDYSNASVWTGAVHYHGPSNPGPEGYIGWMGGPPGDDMGPKLISVAIKNNIIQDFREILELGRIDFDYSNFSNSWFNQVTTEKLQNNMDGLKQIASRDNPYLTDTDDIETAVIKSLTNSKNQSIFGDLYASTDGSGNKRFIFSFDKKQAIKQNTVFPKLVEYLLEEVPPSEAEANAEELLNQQLVKEIRMYRNRVYDENVADPAVDVHEIIQNDEPKLVAVSNDSTSGFLLKNFGTMKNSGKIVGSIKQINIDMPAADVIEGTQVKTVVHYTGTDRRQGGQSTDPLQSSQTTFVGDYVYSIEVTMVDPIIKWMEEKIKDLEIALYGEGTPNAPPGFSAYVNMAKSKPSYYNLYTNRFTQDFINATTGTSAEGGLGSWASWDFHSSRITNFLSVLTSFTSFYYGSQSAGLYNFLLTISSPFSGNPSGVETSFKVMESIYNKILNIFASASKYKKPIDAPQVGENAQGHPVHLAAGSNPRREFVLEHKFNTEIQGGISHLTGYDYLSLQNTIEEDTNPDDGLKNISFGQYDTRVFKETTKLFPSVPAAGNVSGLPIVDADGNVATYDTANITIYQYPLADHNLVNVEFQFETQKANADVAQAQLDKAKEELAAYLASPAVMNALYTPPFAYTQEQAKKIAALNKKIEELQAKASNMQKAYDDYLAEFGPPPSLTEAQGVALNPGDNVHFTKYAYLSPSVVNFEKADSHVLLNDGNMMISIPILNNVLLNILKHNEKAGQEFDFPVTPVATGVGKDDNPDKIIQPNVFNGVNGQELKYDLMNLLSLRQASVSVPMVSTSHAGSTNAGAAIGGSTSADAEVEKEAMEDIAIYLEQPDAQMQYEMVDLFTSEKDPVAILLSVVEQKRFNILSDARWAWEYYVKNAETSYADANGKSLLSFYAEYINWDNILKSQGFSDPYEEQNSPLKRAPNHVKALMLHLDWTKAALQNPAFGILTEMLQTGKPHSYDYEFEETSMYGVDGTNFLGVTAEAYKNSGPAGTSYTQIYAKNKVVYQTPEFLSFFMLNYKNIVKIECFLGYEQGNVNNPIWKELTLAMVGIYKNRKGNVLCRMTPYKKGMYGVERYDFENLPIYNDHFIIDFSEQESNVESLIPAEPVDILVGGELIPLDPVEEDPRDDPNQPPPAEDPVEIPLEEDPRELTFIPRDIPRGLNVTDLIVVDTRPEDQPQSYTPFNPQDTDTTEDTEEPVVATSQETTAEDPREESSSGRLQVGADGTSGNTGYSYGGGS